MKTLLFAALVLLKGALYSQTIKGYSFYEKKYSQAAYPDQIIESLNLSIKEGQYAKNYYHLTYVYEDASVYSTNLSSKIKFATQSVLSAKNSNDKLLIATAYLNRAIIYYRDFGNFQKAVNDLIRSNEAYNLLEQEDLYLYHKTRYHIGVVYQHLGYNEEAIKLFESAAKYYKSQLMEPQYSAIFENHRKGYINSVYQLASCYSKLSLCQKSSSIIKQGITHLEDGVNDALERARYNELLGINYLYLKMYPQSYQYITSANQIYRKQGNKRGVISSTYYLGNFYLKTGQDLKGKQKLNEIDSLYNIHATAVNETYLAYKELLNLNDISEKDKVRFLTKSLEIDKRLNSSNNKISKLIFTKLYHSTSQKSISIKGEPLWRNAFLLFIVLYLGVNNHIKEWYIPKDKYYDLAELVTSSDSLKDVSTEKRKNKMSIEIIEDILKKLDLFEKGAGYLDKDLSLNSLAAQFNSNTAHLSYVINSKKNVRFSAYINELRIKYITNLISTDSKYRNYTVEALAKECGIVSRQSFTKQFQSFNGSTPSEFIQEVKKCSVEVNILHN